MIHALPSLCLWLLIGVAVTVSANNDGAPTQSLRGSLPWSSSNVQFDATISLNISASSRFMTIIKYHGTDDDVVDGHTHTYASVTIPLLVVLSDTPRILEDVEKFEQVVLSFISDNINDLSKYSDINISSASVVEQRLTWEADSKSIGLEVHIEVDASIPDNIHYNKLKKAAQKLLSANNDMFQMYLEQSPSEITDNGDAESIANAWSVLPAISYTLVAIGACGILASIAYILLKMKSNRPEEVEVIESSKSKPQPQPQPQPQPTEIDSKPTIETEESFANDSYLENHSITFPMPYHEKKPEEWDDISVSGHDDLTDDGSFNASVVYCPSVEQRGHDLSALRANIEDNTDSDEEDSDASEGSFRYPPLSPESLQEFDLALRRAEF